jgi:hypothetical protein
MRRIGWMLLGLALLASDAQAYTTYYYCRPYGRTYYPLYRGGYGYIDRGYARDPYSPYTVSSVSESPGIGIVGAPLHGIVCTKGTIAELPPGANRALYIEGAMVGHLGYRCLNFR